VSIPTKIVGSWLAILSAVLACVSGASVSAQQPGAPRATNTAAIAVDAAPTTQRMLQLGTGDAISLQVYGQPDMAVTANVSDDGTIPVPLAGAVRVAGMSPAEAAKAVEKALKTGNFLIDPNVTITVTQSRSQRVSILGEVNTPGRYAIESNTPIYDALAQAGGTKITASDVVYILRPGKDGVVTRYDVRLRDLTQGQNQLPAQTLQGGDSLMVPRAEQFYILGEIQKPDMYFIESGTTVEQAIARAGGITVRGSTRRIEIKRTDSNGKTSTKSAKLSDLVQANDVIRVKESIF
jgi:polysaccharide export outer membrane protein